MATYLPFSDVVAAYGYRQPAPAKQRLNLLMLAFAYVVMGSALGTVAGTGLAMVSFHSGLPRLVFQVAPPVQASATVATAATAVAAPPQLPVLTSQATTAPVRIAKPSPVKLTNANLHVTHPRSNVPQVKTSFHQFALTATSTPIATLSPVTAAAPAPQAVAETAAKDYTFFSEGDVTVADFDASTGRLESYDGRVFVLDTTDVASAGPSLEDSGSSVHYRCDQSGSCTLFRAGQILQNVRLM